MNRVAMNRTPLKKLEPKLPPAVQEGILSQLSTSQKVLNDLRHRELKIIGDDAINRLANANESLARALSMLASREEKSNVRRAIPAEIAASIVNARPGAREYLEEVIKLALSLQPDAKPQELHVTSMHAKHHLPRMSSGPIRDFLTQFGILQRTGSRCSYTYRLTVRGVKIAGLLGILPLPSDRP